MTRKHGRIGAAIVVAMVAVSLLASTALAAPYPWFPPVGGYPTFPWLPPGTNPGNPGTHGDGRVADGFPQGFVVPTSQETGRPVGGWGGDPSGQTDGGAITHVPIVFVHGNSRDAHDFDQVRQYFLDQGYTPNELWAVSYGFGSMQQLDTNAAGAPTVQAFVNSVLDYLQQKNPAVTQVDVITHSMGGTVVRSWLKQSGDYAKVRSFVEIAGPNHGLKGVPTNTQVGQELQPGGQWLNDLNAGDETPGEVRYLTIYDGTGQFDQFYPSNLKDSPRLEGAENHAYNAENGTRHDHLGLIDGTVALQYQWVQNDRVQSQGVPAVR